MMERTWMDNVHAQPTHYRSKNPTVNREGPNQFQSPVLTSTCMKTIESKLGSLTKKAEARYSCRKFQDSMPWACQTCRGTSTTGSPTKTSLQPKCTIWDSDHKFDQSFLWDVILCVASSKHPTAVEMQVVVLVRDNMETLAMRWRWLNPPRTNLPTAGPPAATESASALKKIFGNMCNKLNQCAAKQWGELTRHIRERPSKSVTHNDGIYGIRYIYNIRKQSATISFPAGI